MSKKLVLVEESTEDLLASIEGLEDEAGEDLVLELSNSKAFIFLQNFKLRSGKHQIAKKHLYTLYSKSNLAPVSARIFYKELDDLITTKNAYAYINKDISSLVKEVKPEIKKTDTISLYYMKRFERFLNEYNIVDGEDVYISVKALYYFFDKWTYDKKIQSMWFNKFKRITSLYLKNTKQLTAEISYGLDKKFYDNITEEEISKAKEWAKKYKPTNKNKISSP